MVKYAQNFVSKLLMCTIMPECLKLVLVVLLFMVDGSYKPSLSGMTCPMLYYTTELYYDTIRDAILMCARKPT